MPVLSRLTRDADRNRLTRLSATTDAMPRLRVLRVSYNEIASLDVSFAPKLRTLFADNACLGQLDGTRDLRKLENLSLRDQAGADLMLQMAHIRDLRRFYLSGNALSAAFPSERFYNLTYLELAMCQLDRLPDDLAALVPNVRTLDLSHNPISSLGPLRGLVRLQKLVAVGTRVNKCRPLLGLLPTLLELEEFDLRFVLCFWLAPSR